MTEEEKKTLSDLFEAMGKTGAQFQIGQVIGSQVNNYYEKSAEGQQPQVCSIPEVLAESELWESVKEAGLVNDQGLPAVSRPEAALLADMLAQRLGIANKWKMFEQMWHRNNMRCDYNTALNQKKSLEFQEKLKKILG